MSAGKSAPPRSGLQSDLDRTLWGVDAGPHHLPLLPRDLSVAQIADLAGAKLSDARVADALPASKREIEAGLLAGDQDRNRAVGLGLRLALGERDRPPFPLLPLPELGLKALHMEPVELALPLPVVA